MGVHSSFTYFELYILPSKLSFLYRKSSVPSMLREHDKQSSPALSRDVISTGVCHLPLIFFEKRMTFTSPLRSVNTMVLPSKLTAGFSFIDPRLKSVPSNFLLITTGFSMDPMAILHACICWSTQSRFSIPPFPSVSFARLLKF